MPRPARERKTGKQRCQGRDTDSFHACGERATPSQRIWMTLGISSESDDFINNSKFRNPRSKSFRNLGVRESLCQTGKARFSITLSVQFSLPLCSALNTPVQNVSQQLILVIVATMRKLTCRKLRYGGTRIHVTCCPAEESPRSVIIRHRTVLHQ